MALAEQTQTAPAGTDTGTEAKDIPRGYVEMTFGATCSPTSL